MKALVYYGQRDIKLEDVAKPEPKCGEVLIKITGAGLCQTQVNEFIEGPFINKKNHFIAGHEFGGIVEDVGDKNDSNLIGKRVAVMPLINCGYCGQCKNGSESTCDNAAYYGLNGENGGFAEYACVNKENIFTVEDESIMTFIEPLLVAIHAVSKIRDDIKNKKICVLGAGTIGICVASVLKYYYKAEPVINDILLSRLERVKNAGFDTVGKSELGKYDIVIDCAGSNPVSKSSAFVEGFEYLNKEGILLNIGTYFHPVSFIPSSILVNENSIITSYIYNSKDIVVLPKVINSIKIDFSSLITNIKLRNIIEDGYFRSEVDKDGFTRLVVVP